MDSTLVEMPTSGTGVAVGCKPKWIVFVKQIVFSVLFVAGIECQRPRLMREISYAPIVIHPFKIVSILTLTILTLTILTLTILTLTILTLTIVTKLITKAKA